MSNEGAPEPNKSGRKKDGTFAPGHCANPSGRPPGARGKAALLAEQLIDADCNGIISKMVTLAKGGDVAAARLLIDRLLPAKKDRPIIFELPKIESGADASAALAQVLQAVGNGQLLPSEGEALSKLIESQARLTELAILEQRVAALEEASAK